LCLSCGLAAPGGRNASTESRETHADTDNSEALTMLARDVEASLITQKQP
jgi:hypothetical protein